MSYVYACKKDNRGFSVGDIFPQIISEGETVGGFIVYDRDSWQKMEYDGPYPVTSLSALFGVQALDEEGEPVVDEDDNPVYEDRIEVDPDKAAVDVAKYKASLNQSVKAEYDSIMRDAVSVYPEKEQLGFGPKLTASRSWDSLDDSSKDSEISGYTSDPEGYSSEYLILLAEVNLFSGTTEEKRDAVDLLSASIQNNHDSWCRLYGSLTRDRKRMMAEISAITEDADGLDDVLSYTITWSISSII